MKLFALGWIVASIRKRTDSKPLSHLPKGGEANTLQPRKETDSIPSPLGHVPFRVEGQTDTSIAHTHQGEVPNRPAEKSSPSG